MRAGPRSLVRRLLLQLLAAQVALIVAALLAFPFISPYVSYADIADRTVRQRLGASLLRGDDGQLQLEPSLALQRYAARRPGLACAAPDRTSQQVVPGSAPAS